MITANKFEAANVVRVYSGKPGCGCGCKGKYSDDAKNIARVSKIINAAIEEFGNREGALHPTQPGDDARIGCDGKMAWFESDKRYYWAFFTA